MKLSLSAATLLLVCSQQTVLAAADAEIESKTFGEENVVSKEDQGDRALSYFADDPRDFSDYDTVGPAVRCP